MFYKNIIINTLYIFLFFISFNLSLKAQNVDYEKLSLDELDNGDFSFKDKKLEKIFVKFILKRLKKKIT